MATVAVRPPRFLGERVPTRQQTVQEQIQESLGSGYTVEKSNGGYVAKANPVQYLRVKDSRTKMIRRGQQYQYSTYVPHELLITSEGKVQKEVKRGTYKVDASGKIKEWGVYDSEVTDYDKQTKFTFGTRDMKSGRETVRQTSSLVGGVYKEKRIIDQDTKEYERLKRTPEQAKLIREKGFTVRNTEEYAIAGMSKDQRREYYRLQAKQRSAQLALEAKAQKIARQETAKFRSELSAESQKYAMDIVAQQEAQRPKTQSVFVKVTPGPKTTGPTIDFVPPTPASPITRTDMGDKLPTYWFGGKLPAGELTVAEKPKGIIQRYNRLQDWLSQKQARASAQDRAGATIGLGASQYALGVPMGVYQFGKAIMPWNWAETVGGMVNPESYRLLGQQLQTQPAKTAGEISGSILAGYGLSKGVQAVKTKLDQVKQPTGESGVSAGAKTQKEFVQTKLPTGKERFTGQLQPQEIKFAKTKTGKGQIESTMFSAKVVKDPATGKYVRTPEIGIIRYEIPGDPTRLGTLYQTETYAYAGKPIRVRPEVQQPLVKPQIVATSKWLPGDVRPVTIKTVRGQPTPYVPDWTGGTLRPYNTQEFTLSTVYNKPGLQPSQASAVGFNKLSYTKTYKSPFGDITVTKPPSSGVQQTLPTPGPQVITIVKQPGGKLTPLAGSVQTPGSPRVTTGGPGSQVITTLAPQKYASAGEVITGTLKVYPKTKVVGQAEPIAKFDLPDAQPTPKAPVPTRQSMAGIGLVQISSYQPQQTPTPGLKTSPLISQPTAVIQQPRVSPVARVDITPESLAKYKDEAIAIPAGAQVPLVQPVVISQPILQTETVTELKTDTVLRTEPVFDPITEVIPRARTTRPSEGVPVEPPPEIFKITPTPEEPKKRSGKYQVEVREKGIFKNIGVKGSIKEAFKFGSVAVQETARASFRVTPVGGSKPVSDFGRSLLPKKIFRESKKEPGVFIEKRKYRIDTPGEKKSITFKGILASKSRRSRNIFKL